MTHPTIRKELYFLFFMCHNWLTKNPLKRLKALIVIHNTFQLTRMVQKGLDKGNRIEAWNQGMGKRPNTNSFWEGST